MGDDIVTCGAMAGVKAATAAHVIESDSKATLVDALRASMAFCVSAMAKVADVRLSVQ